MEQNRQAYNIWAEQYDTNFNRTRDLEGIALRSTLKQIQFDRVLEVGCGTGKNSEWLVQQAHEVVGVDFSEEMLAKAKTKVTAGNIQFIHADITKAWAFSKQTFDLIIFSLVLEHIQNLDFIFEQLCRKLSAHGHIYIGELHPYKQYNGSLAVFDLGDGRIELKCFMHHLSEFLRLAKKYNLALIDFDEWFDKEDRSGVPRIMTMLLKIGK